MLTSWLRRGSLKSATKSSRLVVAGSPPSLVALISVMALLVGVGVFVVTRSHAATVSIWPDSATPDVSAEQDTAAVELGVKFNADVSGKVTGIRFYKGTGNGGAHTGSLWSSTGTKLGTVIFSGETATGWQSASFSNPISITAGVTYIASYFAPQGHYSSTNNGLANAVDASPLHALSGTSGGGNGVYVYSAASAFPTQSYQNTNYWVDLTFQPDQTTSSLVGDLNNDNTVNVFDLSILLSHWGQSGTGDLNADNTVNIFDLSILLSHWGQTATPTPTPTRTPTPSPSPTPSPTPAPTPSGTPAPGGFPNAANTGPAAAGYTNLTPYTGPQHITTAGTVVSGKIITAPLYVEASNVTVQGNLIHGPTSVASDTPAIYISGTGAKILDNEIRGDSASVNTQDPASGIKVYASGVTLSRNNIYWVAGDGITIDANQVTITDNFMHDFASRSGVHYDGVVDGNVSNANLTIRHNTLQMWVDGMMTAIISLQQSTAGFLVDNNLLAGGGYTVEGGQQWTNNHFSKMFSPNCGAYGPVAFTPAWGSNGRVWSGNVWDDTGAVIPAP